MFHVKHREGESVSDEREQLTREQAEACVKIVQAWVGKVDPEAAALATLYEPGFQCGGWAVTLQEQGPEDWPMWVCDMVDDEWPKGVFAEPVSHWCLGLYVEWSART
jgi:hypothetical protein